MDRALRLYLLGRSDREIGEALGVDRKTVAGWKQRADWKQRAEQASRADDEWHAERRREWAKRADLEAMMMLDEGGALKPSERIELVKLLGKWGGLEIKRIEAQTTIDLDGMSDEELRAIVEQGKR